MNIFVNDVVQVIYNLRFDSLSQNSRDMLGFVMLLLSLYGTYFAYMNYRNKYKFPILYVVPFIREFLILLRDDNTLDKQMLGFTSATLYLAGFIGITNVSLTGDTSDGVTALILIFIALIIGAYLNYDFLCYCTDVPERKRNVFMALLYYFFPVSYLGISYYIIYKRNEKLKKKRKGYKAHVAKFLVFIIFIQSLLIPPVEVKASEPHIETICPICNNSNEQIIYRVAVDFATETIQGYSQNEFYYGVTCRDCEIIHLVKSDVDFNICFEDDGPCNDHISGAVAFIDYRNVRNLSNDEYVPTYLCYDEPCMCLFIDAASIVYCEPCEVYSSGIYSNLTGKEDKCFYTIPAKDAVGLNDHNGLVTIAPNAVRRVPKGSGKGTTTFVSDVNEASQITSNTQGALQSENIQQSAGTKETTSTKTAAGWTNKDSVDVVSGILGGSVSAIGMGVGVDLVLTGVTMVNPILGGVLFGCTCIIGATVGYKMGSSLGEKIFTGFLDDDVSETDRAAAKKELGKEVLVDAATLTVSSAAMNSIAPKVSGAIDSFFCVKLSPTPELVNHLENPTLKGNVISGGHNEVKFIEFCEQNGIKYEQIKADLPKGMKKYSYNKPGKSAHTKTVYDTNNMTLDNYLDYGTGLINSYAKSHKWTTVKEDNFTTVDSYGIKWQVYFNGDKVSTFYPID